MENQDELAKPWCNRALAAATAVATRWFDCTTAPPVLTSLPEALQPEVDYYLHHSESKQGTVLYLAYGSNLSKETFRGRRAIQPISQVNVQVPSLRLTFDLPGIPYQEPCFANTARRDPANDRPESAAVDTGDDEKHELLLPARSHDRYHKDRWHKGLIGVVYEVTPADYAHIIQTEGGGSSYQDVLVDCHAIATRDAAAPVPLHPTSPAFQAHTLFAPAAQPGDDPPADGGRNQRPDTSYAQPSARYLKLITDGAAELELPFEYQDFLLDLRPYTITSFRQRLGQAAFISFWLPFLLLALGLGKLFADDEGRLPRWLRVLTAAIFKAAWTSYDRFFKGAFGDGERTVTDRDDVESEYGMGLVEARSDNLCDPSVRQAERII